ncbi:hypothetical protein MSAN_01338600 [Mycena sanguinolenta]|uniref:Uncharacterized protein n=1 Tax=Mycena sanguinolenta TaxID=230812 RepID=A0A8H6YFP3_9AGAR|nr:hypothetical protein MSAN_01338600 [Mycena sanguinolenta]
MLLFLSLGYLLAGHRAVSGLPLASREEPVSCDSNVNSRSLLTILSGCLVTVFACTWVSVHPNVPPPNQSKLARRLGLMLVAVIAPELMVGFAARQFLDARWFAKEDKSKGDSISKGVALLQGLWFIAQCLARVHQRLPLTQLEVATLAFQVVSVFIWVLWWYKPLDVEQSIRIPGIEFVPSEKPKYSIAHSLLSVYELTCLGTYSEFEPLTSTFVPAFWSTHGLHWVGARFAKSVAIQFLFGTTFGVIHCAAWNTYFPSAAEKWLWRFCSLVVASVPLFLTLLALAVHNRWVKYPNATRMVEKVIGESAIGIPLLVYVVARLILIALSFTTLRALPPAAFVDVNWTAYIPHL